MWVAAACTQATHSGQVTAISPKCPGRASPTRRGRTTEQSYGAYWQTGFSRAYKCFVKPVFCGFRCICVIISTLVIFARHLLFVADAFHWSRPHKPTPSNRRGERAARRRRFQRPRGLLLHPPLGRCLLSAPASTWRVLGHPTGRPAAPPAQVVTGRSPRGRARRQGGRLSGLTLPSGRMLASFSGPGPRRRRGSAPGLVHLQQVARHNRSFCHILTPRRQSVATRC